MAVAALPHLRRRRDPLAVRHGLLVRACALTVRAARSARRRTARTAAGATVTAALGAGTAVNARAVLIALVLLAVAAFLVGAGWVWRGQVDAVLITQLNAEITEHCRRVCQLDATVDGVNRIADVQAAIVAGYGAQNAALWAAELDRHQPKRGGAA